MKGERILIGGGKKVEPQEILMLQADVNYTIVFFKNGKKCIVATTLKTLESRFEPFNFFRLNRSMLVNLDYVKSVAVSHKKLKMADDKEIVVARRRLVSFRKTLLME